MLEPVAVKCPSCHELVEPAPRCPRCRFTLQKLTLQFGVAPRHFGVFSDFTQQLERAETRKLTARLNLFQRKFPQSTLSVFITELPRGATVGDYAFWLANRIRFSDVEAVGEHNFDLVLAVDIDAGAAALTAGYGLESCVAEADLAAALEAGRAAFAAQDLVSGIEQCIRELTERLRTITRRARSRTRRL